MRLRDDALDAAAKVKFQKIREIFETYLERRLGGLTPRERELVEAKIRGIQAHYFGTDRGFVVSGAGDLQLSNGTLIRAELGDLFFNSSNQENLYAIFTFVHELEHVIDVVRAADRPFGWWRDSFRFPTFSQRSEPRAFAAAHGFFQELKARGVEFEDVADVLLQMHPIYRRDPEHYKRQILEMRAKGRAHLYDEDLVELARFDAVDHQTYVNFRMGQYYATGKFDREFDALMKRYLAYSAGGIATAGLAAYFGWDMFTAPPQAAPRAAARPAPVAPSAPKYEYRSEPGLWDEDNYKRNGIALARDLAREQACAGVGSDRKRELAANFGLGAAEWSKGGAGAVRMASARSGAEAVSIVVIDATGKLVFRRTFSGGSVFGATTLTIPADAESGIYRVRVCSHSASEPPEFLEVEVPLK